MSHHLSEEQKRDITGIFNSIFIKPLNQSPHIITRDIILNGIEVINTEMVLKTKMSRFYEQLFCYLCNFKHQETGFNLVNEKEDIFVDLKTNFLSDNFNAKHNKFHHFKKYITNNSNAKIFYICLNDKRKKY